MTTQIAPIFPIFQACKEYTIYPFWLGVFDAMSLGKFPPQILQFDPKTFRMTFRYKLDLCDATKIWNCGAGLEEVIFTKTAKPLSKWGVYRLTTKYLMYFGVHSRGQLPKASFPPRFEYTCWSGIRSRSVKEELLSEYIDTTYPTDPDRADRFFELMALLQTKQLSPDDITMSEGKIVEINTHSGGGTTKPTRFAAYEKSKKRNTCCAIKSFTKDRKKRLLLEKSSPHSER
jgi:hypothetical protein